MLHQLIDYACHKDNFLTVEDYATFCQRYLEYIQDGLQAVIVSCNENNYRFFQYGNEGAYAVTRPINSSLMLSVEDFDNARNVSLTALPCMRELREDMETRSLINRFVYTCQQSIGATLDALPTRETNRARKINGDLFEQFIRQILIEMGIDARSGTVQVPIVSGGETLFSMTYQHDLMVCEQDELKAIGSVKTSSKDRLDKIFIDKFLYNRLTETNMPHFAVFLNDVQRKGAEPHYGVNIR